jgi:hypothetical protein
MSFRTHLIKIYSDYADRIIQMDPKGSSLPRRLIHPLIDLYHGDSFASVYRKLIHRYFIESSYLPQSGNDKLAFSERMDIIRAHMCRLYDPVMMEKERSGIE